MRALRLFVCAGLAALLGLSQAARATPVFKHVIMIVQENRTPDDMFGSDPTFEPGVDIGTSGVSSTGAVIPLTSQAYIQCYDISHEHVSFVDALTKGADQSPLSPEAGCVLPANPQFKYIDNSKGIVAPYFALAEDYGFANRMFQTNEGPSFPAHLFLFGATSQPTATSDLFVAENPPNQKGVGGCLAPASQTVRLIDPNGSETTNAPIAPCTEHPTLSDVLESGGKTWRYYGPSEAGIWMAPSAIQHICEPGMIGGRYGCAGSDWTSNVVVNSNRVVSDIQKCKLTNMTWVIPDAGESDHATESNGSGPSWVASIVNAVGEQPACAKNNETYWSDTVILITWDDWGGWYDHVAPPAVLTNTGTPVWGDGYVYGFRVPLMVVSAYTPAHYVDNAVHDFGSLLYFVEQNFGLPTIGPGGTSYGYYADYWAETRKWTDMAGFFGLTTPRAFTPIPTASGQDANFFSAHPSSNIGPDNE